MALVSSTEVLAQTPSPVEAKALLSKPKGSISLGFTNSGKLRNGSELPAKGKGYQIISHVLPRRTNHGTDELIGLIERATAKVNQRFPGSVLGIGNLGFADGTKIPWSVSHQAGRDADLSFYASVNGKPYEKGGKVLPLTYFGPNLIATGQKGKYAPRFDVKRNLALVQAMLEDVEGARIQYLFVANWLRDAMLAEARQQHLPWSLIGKMAEVLQQPSDSNAHNDHFHLRLYCTIEDRLHGCKNRGVTRSWVNLGDREVNQTATKLVRILNLDESKHEALIVEAIQRLGAMGAVEQLSAVGQKLSAKSTKVRKVSLQALKELADAKAADVILARLPEVTDGAWAAELVSILPSLDAPKLIGIAEHVAARPEHYLHAKARARAEGPILVTVLSLLRDHGQKSSVSVIKKHLASKDAKVKRAAVEALEALTCHSVSDLARFDAFWAKQQVKALSALAEEGVLRQRWVRAKSLRSKAGVESLIRLLDKRSVAQQACSHRALERITGRTIERTLRTPARNKRQWQHWWKANASRFGWR